MSDEQDVDIVELDLVRMAKEGARESKKKKEHSEEPPSFGRIKEGLHPLSQVLVILHRTCKNCGTVFEVPNKSKLVRLDPDKYKQISKPETWEVSYDTLPKEKVIRKDTVDQCQMCWKGRLTEL